MFVTVMVMVFDPNESYMQQVISSESHAGQFWENELNDDNSKK